MKLSIKMDRANIKFGDIEIEKQKFYLHERPFSIKNIDINKIIVSNVVCFGKKEFKNFIGYKHAKNWTFMYISAKIE